MKTKLFLLLSLITLIFFLAFTPILAYENNKNTSLENLIQVGINNNSDLKSRVARVKMSELKISQVRSLPDPMLKLDYKNEGWSLYSFGTKPNSEWMIGGTQDFPLWGKLDTQAQLQTQEFTLFYTNMLLAKTQLITQIKEAYYDYYKAYKTLEWLHISQDVLKNIEDLALKRYSVGTETHDNVLMIGIDRYMNEEKITTMETELIKAKNNLQQLCQLPDDSLLTTPNELPLTNFSINIIDAQKQALTNSLEIKETIIMLNMAKSKVEIAQKEIWSDIAINADVIKKAAGMEDMWRLGINIPIPLYSQSKQIPAIKEADTGVLAATQNIEFTSNVVLRNLKTDMAMLNAANRLLNLYQIKILPNTQHLISINIANYQNNKVILQILIDNIRNLFATEISAINIKTDHEKALARILAMIKPEVE